MTARLEALVEEIVRLQGELDREIERRRTTLGWRLRAGLVEFEEGVLTEHRRVRQGVGRFLGRSPFANVATAPVIYSLIIPLVLIDVWVSLYQAICFRAWRIPRAPRSQYVVLDRGRLAYLNGIEIVNCVFCEYANGVIAYVREVASRTEQYWCPIKHALRVSDPHERYARFLEYGDAEGYRARLEAFREALRAPVPEA
ncbi:MAG: hypothetical protein K0M78_11380 [Brevundimonas sp.]|nr:hypothetical protein [Brevundimonas sp.]